jgi:ATP-dependent DNA helicase RecG
VIRGEEGPDLDDVLRRSAAGARGELSDLLGSIAGLGRADRRREAARALRMLREDRSSGPPEARTAPPRRRRAPRPRPLPPDVEPIDLPVESLPGIGPKAAQALRGQLVRTVGDLLELLPRRYEDRRRVVEVPDLREGVWAVVQGEVVHSRMRGPPWSRRVELRIESGGAGVDVVFFHARPGMSERFARGVAARLAGVPRRHGEGLQIAHPEIVAVGDEASEPGRVTARYPIVRGVAPRSLAKAVAAALDRPIPEVLPASLRDELGLPDRRTALAEIHRPSGEIDAASLAALEARATPAHRLLAAEELLLHEVVAAGRRAESEAARATPLRPGDAFSRVEAILPFVPTRAQRRVSAEILADLATDRPMRRLLQGDVGSGKTVVALAAIAAALDAGRQAAIMAPTEILAVQHARTLRGWVDALGHRLALVLGSQKSSERRKVRRDLELGSALLAIGTHALLTQSVDLPRLGLCVVDEQHRFGVAQRLALVEKGAAPHLLVMTATPIPRSLALALHGDLALSTLDERPPGRTPPATTVHGPKERERVYDAVQEALDRGERGFVVCPLVEDSEFSEAPGAVPLHEELARRFDRHAVALLHGRLGPEQKLAAMEEFAAGRARLLVATTIVEVGIDVPDATFVVVDGAERLGLSALHQIRGRVGRGGGPSRCLLVHGDVEPPSAGRLQDFAATDDGFEVAEIDLRVRGPGELWGLRQSGAGSGFAFADPLRDLPLIEPVRRAAREIRAADPDLADSPRIAEAVRRRWPVTGRPVREDAG